MTDNQGIAENSLSAKTKERRNISPIWIIPFVALLVGGWLAFKAIRDKGPTITITFIHAEGLEAGKTKIKYRNVDIGQVESVALSKDLSYIEVTAKLVKGSEWYLTTKTMFWVVRARVTGTTVSGLGTLLSGAYIGIEPHPDGQPAKEFIGLETPPVVTVDQNGSRYHLIAETLGSLDRGSPVYYRQIKVGQVIGYEFDKERKNVDIQIFIEAPFDKQVTDNTRFWNASGIDVTLNAQGLKVQTQSMVSILSGGIAFDLPRDTPSGAQAKENAVYHLYPDQTSVQEKNYTIRNYWLLLFDESVRGLSEGASVEFQGIKVGEVVSLNLTFDAASKQFIVPVVVAIEPQRVKLINQSGSRAGIGISSDQLLRDFIEQRGLRAQLQSGNFLTGQLMINLAFFPESPKITLTYEDDLPVVPTIPRSFRQIQETITKLADKIDKFPLDKIGGDVHSMLQGLKTAIDHIGKVAQTVDEKTAPQLQQTLVELQNTLRELQGAIGSQSPLNYKAKKTFDELTQTLRSLRDLIDTLDQRPQSLIFGKEGEKNE